MAALSCRRIEAVLRTSDIFHALAAADSLISCDFANISA